MYCSLSAAVTSRLSTSVGESGSTSNFWYYASTSPRLVLINPPKFPPLIHWPWKFPGYHPGGGVIFHIPTCYQWNWYGYGDHLTSLDWSPDVTYFSVLPTQLLDSITYIIGELARLPNKWEIKHLTPQIITTTLKYLLLPANLVLIDVHFSWLWHWSACSLCNF